MKPGNKINCDKVSYSEVTLICKEEGKGGTEYNKESKDGCLKKGGEKKASRGGKEGERKPRGTDINFGKVAPKTLMSVFNTSQNLLSLVKMRFPSKTQDLIQLKKKI